MNLSQLREYLETKAPIKRHVITGDSEYVHNVLDTKDEPKPAGYDFFLDFWKSKTGVQGGLTCAADASHKNADGADSDLHEIVGAHVRLDDAPCPDDWAWIVPLCKHCNRDENTRCILLKKGTVLIPIKMSRPHETASSEFDMALKALHHIATQNS